MSEREPLPDGVVVGVDTDEPIAASAEAEQDTGDLVIAEAINQRPGVEAVLGGRPHVERAGVGQAVLAPCFERLLLPAVGREGSRLDESADVAVVGKRLLDELHDARGIGALLGAQDAADRVPRPPAPKRMWSLLTP